MLGRCSACRRASLRVNEGVKKTYPSAQPCPIRMDDDMFPSLHSMVQLEEPPNLEVDVRKGVGKHVDSVAQSHKPSAMSNASARLAASPRYNIRPNGTEKDASWARIHHSTVSRTG